MVEDKKTIYAGFDTSPIYKDINNYIDDLISSQTLLMERALDNYSDDSINQATASRAAVRELQAIKEYIQTNSQRIV